MTDNPRDPTKPGTYGAKRPAATIDLQAIEIETSEPKPDDSISGKEADATGEIRNSETWSTQAKAEETAKADVSEPETNKQQSPASARHAAVKPKGGSSVGGLISHLAAGALGAGLAVFGADYLVNTVGLSLPTYSAAQVDQLNRRIATLEQDARDHSNDPAANLMREQLDALKVKVEQTAGATGAIPAIQSEQKQLAEKAAKLDQQLTAQPPGSETTGRIAKLEDQFNSLAQAGAAGQGGNAGTMAALITKVDSIGANLDTHLDEMRKSLQAELQKQSTHFEDRLTEVDKSMSVDTLKATGKTLTDQIVGLKTDADKLHQDIATVAAGNQSLRQDLAALQQATADLKTQIASQAGTFAKSQQLTDVNATQSKLQAELAAIAARDQTREQSANRILLMLDLGNLKRAAQSGAPYAKELAEVKRLAPKDLNLSTLDASADKGLSTNAVLTSEYKDLTWSLLNADTKPTEDGSLLGQLWQGARSVVQVRRTGEVAGDSTEAIVARTEGKLQLDDLEGALRETTQLKGGARKIAEPWMAKLASKLAVDQAMGEVESGLAKLMGPSSAAPSGTN